MLAWIASAATVETGRSLGALSRSNVYTRPNNCVLHFRGASQYDEQETRRARPSTVCRIQGSLKTAVCNVNCLWAVHFERLFLTKTLLIFNVLHAKAMNALEGDPSDKIRADCRGGVPTSAPCASRCHTWCEIAVGATQRRARCRPAGRDSRIRCLHASVSAAAGWTKSEDGRAGFTTRPLCASLQARRSTPQRGICHLSVGAHIRCLGARDSRTRATKSGDRLSRD